MAHHPNHYTHEVPKSFSNVFNASLNYLMVFSGSSLLVKVKSPLAEYTATICCIILPLNSNFNLFSNVRPPKLTSVDQYLLNDDFVPGSALDGKIQARKSVLSSPPRGHNLVTYTLCLNPNGLHYSVVYSSLWLYSFIIFLISWQAPLKAVIWSYSITQENIEHCLAFICK